MKQLFEIEGHEFSGKTTLINMLSEHYNQNSFVFKAPGCNETYDMIRNVWKYKSINQQADMFLSIAAHYARYEQLKNIDKDILISDRGLLSFVIYSVIMLGNDTTVPDSVKAIVKDIKKQYENEFETHRIVLRISKEEQARRRSTREIDTADKNDNASEATNNKIFDLYNTVSVDDKWFDPVNTWILDVDHKTPNEIMARVIDYIDSKTK